MMLEHFKRVDIAADGVIFNAKEKSSGLNFKNAMYNQFLYELRADRVKYPAEVEVEKDIVFNKHYTQWCMLERIRKLGINDAIRAPEGDHDDGPDSDIMAIYAADKTTVFKGGRTSSRRIPKPVTGVGSIANPTTNKGK